ELAPRGLELKADAPLPSSNRCTRSWGRCAANNTRWDRRPWFGSWDTSYGRDSALRGRRLGDGRRNHDEARLKIHLVLGKRPSDHHLVPDDLKLPVRAQSRL